MGVALIFSGLAGISYEILYGRILGGLIGDQFAVSSAVLITFLLGIGLGSRYARRLWGFLWLVELLIGLYGMGVAVAGDALGRVVYGGAALLPGLAGPVLFGVLILIFPAFLIGCSVPLFAGYFSRVVEGGAFSRVYSVYNASAGLTAILIEFLIIRRFGISGAVIFFGVLNVLTAALLLLFGRGIASAPPVSEKGGKSLRFDRRILSLVLVGIASAIFQLFMIKISEMLFGPFRETFALVLAIVLFGIALGSFIVKRFNAGYSGLLFANLAGLLLFLLLLQPAMHFYALHYKAAVEQGTTLILLKGAVLTLLMGVPAVTFGAVIPALVKGDGEVTAESGGLLFVSSLANVGGFLAMAFVLHRHLDYGVIALVVAVLVLAATAVFVGRNARYAVASVVLTVLIIFSHRLVWDEDLLYLSYTSFHSGDDMRENRAAFQFPEKFKGNQDVFSINWVGGHPYFFINGYISFPMDNPSEKIVGALGAMYSPKIADALVLGLGSGTTASVPGMVFGHTDVVEINPVVRENLFRMKRWNFDIEHNPKVSIFIDDAIHHVKSGKKEYDMILSTVTSPLYFSSAKLYTLDFFKSVKKRLRPDGIYVTWIDARIGDEGAEIILKTINKTWGHCALFYIKSSYFLLIASDQPVRLQRPELGEDAAPVKTDLMANHTRVPRLLAYHLTNTDVARLAEDSTARVNTLDIPTLEFAIARMNEKGFVSFKKKLVESIGFEKIRDAIEPAMKYDPVEQAAEANFSMKGSSIAAKLRRDGRIYISDFDRRMDDATLGIYQTIAEKLDTGEAHHQLGFQYLDRDKYDLAIGEFEKTLLKEPAHRNTLFNLASCHEYKGEYAKALEFYEAAVRQYPNDPDVPHRMARVFFRTGNYDKALGKINEALVAQKSFRNFKLLGNIQEKRGDKDAAVSAFFKALGKRPDDREIQKSLARLIAK